LAPVAVWGQTDSVVNLLGFISVLSLLRKNLTLSLVFLVLSLLFKGSLAIFIPILLFIAVMQRHPLKRWLLGIILSLTLVVLVTVWFHPNFDLPVWLVNLYKNRILPGEIGYLTANAFNLWWLINPGKVYDSSLFLGLQLRTSGFVMTLMGRRDYSLVKKRYF
jgi:Gpi18-like mannosyltransferase